MKEQEAVGKGKPVVVTTALKGVFFGYLPRNAQPDLSGEITLAEARMAVYWSEGMKGVLGLASIGPDKSCRIGPAVPMLTLNKVTAVAECTAEATAKWEKGLWND